MGLFSSDLPAAVKKWMPGRVRRGIERYQPSTITPQTLVHVWVIVTGGVVHIVFENWPVRVHERLSPKFNTPQADWQELVEVAAWVIKLVNPGHIARAKQLTSKLTDDCKIQLNHRGCTAYHLDDDQLLGNVEFS